MSAASYPYPIRALGVIRTPMHCGKPSVSNKNVFDAKEFAENDEMSLESCSKSLNPGFEQRVAHTCAGRLSNQLN